MNHQLFVMVSSDEDTYLGIIDDAIYDAWLDDDTGFPDHCSLFWSDRVSRFDDWAALNRYVGDNDIVIVGVLGGLQY